MAYPLTANDEILHIDDNEYPFNVDLKRHQLALLLRCLNVEQNMLNGSTCPFGIMSDKAGTGKTFVVLAFIYYCMKFLDGNGLSISLIVVPPTIFTQWENAFSRFYPSRTVQYKSFRSYEEITNVLADKRLITNYNIILTTPVLYNNLAKTICSLNIPVKRIFFDEADTIQNVLNYRISTRTTWFISASIQNVFDNRTKRAKIGGYDIALNDMLKNNCFCSADFIDENIRLPPPISVTLNCRNFYIDTIITKLFNKADMKPIYAHDFTDKSIKVMTNQRATKTPKDLLKNIYECSQKTLAQNKLHLEQCRKDVKYARPRADKAEKDAQLYKAEQDEIKYREQFNTVNDFCDNNLICIQCFSQIPTPEFKTDLSYRKTHCGNIVCDTCYNAKMEATKYDAKTCFPCVKCGKDHMLIEYIPDTISVGHSYNEEIRKSNLDKFYVLAKTIGICGKKVIIVSQYLGIHNFLQTDSHEKGYKYRELNAGNINGLDEVLRDFKEKEEIKILLIDSSTCSVGMNIEYATDIVFFHEVSPLMRHQLVGRCQRFGRVGKLYIWNLLYDGEEYDEREQSNANSSGGRGNRR
jgi:hypothetical protein